MDIHGPKDFAPYLRRALLIAAFCAMGIFWLAMKAGTFKGGGLLAIIAVTAGGVGAFLLFLRFYESKPFQDFEIKNPVHPDNRPPKETIND